MRPDLRRLRRQPAAPLEGCELWVGCRSPWDPPLGAILEPKLAQVGPMLGHVEEKIVSKHLWKTCCLLTSIFYRFFNEICSPKAPWGHQKSSKNMGGLSKFKVFGFPSKVALGRHLGASFGRFLGPKLRPRGVKLGPCCEKKPNENSNDTNNFFLDF